MKENSSREDEAAAKSGTFTSARLTPAASPYDPRAIAQIPSQAPTPIGQRKFFKNKDMAEQRSNSKALSSLYYPWKTDKKPLVKAKKVTKTKPPVSNDKDRLPPLLKNTITKPPPPVPVFNGNFPPPSFPSQKVAPTPSTSGFNGNNSADAADDGLKKPARISQEPPPPLELIDLSGSEEQEPRSGFVSPHQVGFQVNLV